MTDYLLPPFGQINLDALNEESIGALIFYFELFMWQNVLYKCGKMSLMMWQNDLYKNVPRLCLCMFHGGGNIY